MFDRTDVIYLYDGSFDGLMCCVFESFEKKELPSDIQVEGEAQFTLMPLRAIEMDMEKAQRVKRSIPKKISDEAMEFIQTAFLTILSHKERCILDFIQKGFQWGSAILDRLTDDTVHTMSAAVRHIGNETHRFKQFIRFSDYDGILVAVIHPKNMVLPLLREHFCDRYSLERFLIYDAVHGAALVYRPGQWAILPMDRFVLEAPDEEEQKYQDLWRKYYETVAVEGRENPRCRMNHMPKRYWDDMTEFQSPQKARRFLEDRH